MNVLNFKIESIEYICEELKKDSGKNLIIISSKNKDKIFWKLILRNVLLEEIKGFHKIWNELFIIVNNKIIKIDINTGKKIIEKSFGNTQINKIIIRKEDIYLLLYYYEFDSKKYQSNILCVNNFLKIKWYAELFDKDDIYTNIITKGKNIIGYTWNGWDCTINSDNGKIKNKRFTK